MNQLLNYQKAFPIFLIIALLSAPVLVSAQEKIPITSADQLPVRTIHWEGKMIDKINDDAFVMAMCDTLERRLLSDLETYAISDRSTLSGYYQGLLMIAFTRGDYDRSVELIEEVKGLIEKESERVMTGNFILSL